MIPIELSTTVIKLKIKLLKTMHIVFNSYTVLVNIAYTVFRIIFQHFVLIERKGFHLIKRAWI